MIKFFRKIKQNLLTENKFNKYLLYAGGEIVLVVIGILIALSINNANENDKLRQKEITLLTEMGQNLTVDLLDLEYNIKGNTSRTLANETVLAALTSRTPMHDSLKGHYGGIFGNFQLSENAAAWATLKSVGLDLISNDSLRNTITNLYTVKYEYLENVESGVDDSYQWNIMYPQILEHINIEQLWISAEPVDHEELMDNRKFQETLKMNLFMRKYVQTMYSNLYENINKVLNQIENHIQTLTK